MRIPTPREPLYAWWRKAVEACGNYGSLTDADRAGVEIPQIDEAMPQAGFYKTREGRHRPFIPAKIYLEQHVDKDGSLTQPEVWRCLIGDDFFDPEESWIRLCNWPITEAEYRYLCDVRDWAADWEPNAPERNPQRQIDHLRRPLPVFKKKRTR